MHSLRWKIGTTILILVFVSVFFSKILATSSEKSVSSERKKIVQSQKQRIPLFLQKVMEEEGISRKDLRDNPKLREKLKEKIKTIHSPSSLTEERKEVKSEEDYYRVIVEKNLFRPLGTGAEKKGPLFMLLGTVIAKSKEEVNKALIKDLKTNQTVYVSEGEKVGVATVKMVKPGEVVLLHDGERKELRLKELQFINSRK